MGALAAPGDAPRGVLILGLGGPRRLQRYRAVIADIKDGDAWSTPDIGGWILFGVMGLLAGVYVLEVRDLSKNRKALGQEA